MLCYWQGCSDVAQNDSRIFYYLLIHLIGKLTTDQIKAGYAALKKIDACLEKGDFGSTLTQACDEFYTRIPHDFG